MSKAIVLQHVEAEGPGRIVPVFRDFGIPLDIRKLHRGDEVPTDLDEGRGLIVLGGPMGGGAGFPGSVMGRRRKRRGGALSAADPLPPRPEMGWAPVTFPFPGGTEP